MTDDEKPPILAHSHKDEDGDESHGRQYDYYERNTYAWQEAPPEPRLHKPPSPGRSWVCGWGEGGEKSANRKIAYRIWEPNNLGMGFGVSWEMFVWGFRFVPFRPWCSLHLVLGWVRFVGLGGLLLG